MPRPQGIGSIKWSTANEIGAALVNVLGGDGYAPKDWSDAINLCGIRTADIESALASLTPSQGTGIKRGTIELTTANKIGSVLKKKYNNLQGFSPKFWASAISNLEPLPEITASGSIVSFSDGANGVPLKSLLCNIDANFSGVSSVDVKHTGANLFNEDWEVGGLNDTTGLPNSDTNKIRSKTFSAIKGGITIYIKTPQPIRVLFYKDTETFLSETSNIRNSTFTVPSEAKLFKIRGTVDYGTTYNNDISINAPSTDTEYHAYHGETKTAQLGRTIYGGSVDMFNGIGTDKNARIPFSDCTWAGTTHYQSNFNAENGIVSVRFGQTAMANAGYAQTAQGVVCNVFENNGRSPWNRVDRIDEIGFASGICVNMHYSEIGLSEWTDDDSVVLAAWKTCQLYQTGVFSLVKATPEEFTFTPITTINTYLGNNNIWHDTGSSTLIYRQDLDYAT